MNLLLGQFETVLTYIQYDNNLHMSMKIIFVNAVCEVSSDVVQ